MQTRIQMRTSDLQHMMDTTETDRMTNTTIHDLIGGAQQRSNDVQ